MVKISRSLSRKENFAVLLDMINNFAAGLKDNFFVIFFFFLGTRMTSFVNEFIVFIFTGS